MQDIDSSSRSTETKTFGYRETVFVSGNTQAYLADLENYFRDSLRDISFGLGKKLENQDFLRKAIQRQLEDSSFDYLISRDNYGCPFFVDKTHSSDAADWLEEDISITRRLIASQRINRTGLLEIVKGKATPVSLDITNYAHRGIVVMIQQPTLEAVRMRIFLDRSLREGYVKEYAESFAQHARHLIANPVVNARVETEEGVTDNPPDLESYVQERRAFRSRLRLTQPTFDVIKSEDGYTYSIPLAEAEREMLSHFHINVRDKGSRSLKREELCYESTTWSPHQGEIIIRNLFGILGLAEKPARGGRTCYSYFFVPLENKRAAKVAISTGSFKKKVERESLPVLKVVFDRTLELKNTYGWDFYPRFSRQEVSHMTGLTEEEAKSHMMHLEGILTEVSFTRRRKWFLPKSRISLAFKILNLEGLAQ